MCSGALLFPLVTDRETLRVQSGRASNFRAMVRVNNSYSVVMSSSSWIRVGPIKNVHRNVVISKTIFICRGVLEGYRR
jgi:hypothetical protein